MWIDARTYLILCRIFGALAVVSLLVHALSHAAHEEWRSALFMLGMAPIAWRGFTK